MSMRINNATASYTTNHSSAISQKSSSRQEEKTTGKTDINTAEYKAALLEKNSCLNSSNNCSVTIAPGLLSKAATDEKTAQWLEYNLSLMPDVINNVYETVAQRGSRVLSYSVSFDSYDCMTAQLCTVSEADPGTDDTKHLLEKVMSKNKERKEEQEALLEKSREKTAHETAQPFTMRFNGKNTNDLMRNMPDLIQPNTDFSDLMGRINITV